MPMILILRYWKYGAMIILALLVVLMFANWQKAREQVGEWKEKYNTQVTYSKGLTNQLAEANAKIQSTSKQAAVSYGHCQDLVANDASRNFDNGVVFGRATCPAISSSVSPAVRR